MQYRPHVTGNPRAIFRDETPGADLAALQSVVPKPTAIGRVAWPTGRMRSCRSIVNTELNASDVNVLAGIPILVVDDDVPSARLLSAVLAEEGADNVRIAHTAEAALSILQSISIRVLLFDLMLPGMGGLELLRRVKAHPRTAGIVAIGISGLGGPEVARQAREGGCAEFVQKPIDCEAVVEMLRAHVI